MDKGGKDYGEPVRILQYIGSLEAGGSQSMIMNYYRNIDRSKIQFDFIVDRSGEGDMFYKDEIESLGGKVYIFKEYFRGYNYFSFTRQWKEFFCAHLGYKIIHCHVRSVASIVLRIAKKNGLKTICHSHSISNGEGPKAVVKKILQGRIKKYCDYFFACSRDAAIWLYGEKIANTNRCVVVDNAIEVDKYYFSQKHRNEIRNKYSIRDEMFVVGYVGRFERPKNPKFILELIESTKEDRDIVFILCGDGTLKKDFQEMIKEKGLEYKVVFVAGTKEIHKYYSAFDYFIFPSLYEGLGMALVEAQLSGLACLISPNIPKEAKISDNVVVEELLIEKWREKILEKRINKARKDVQLFDAAKKFDVKQVSKRFQQLYLDYEEEEKARNAEVGCKFGNFREKRKDG